VPEEVTPEWLRAEAEREIFPKQRDMRLDQATLLETREVILADDERWAQEQGIEGGGDGFGRRDVFRLLPLPRQDMRRFLDTVLGNTRVSMLDRNLVARAARELEEWQEDHERHARILEMASSVGTRIEKFPELRRIYQKYLDHVNGFM